MLETIDPELLIPAKQLVARIVEGYEHGAVQNAPRSRSVLNAASINSFTDLVKLAIEEEIKNTGHKEELSFTHELPDKQDNISGDIITYTLLRRAPGVFGKGEMFGGSPVRRKPSLREIYDDPETPGYRIFSLGWLFDNEISFTCWSRTNKAAENRAEWLEGLMLNYEWFFQMGGVPQVLYKERTRDVWEKIDNFKVSGKPLIYWVRTEKIFQVKEKALESLALKIMVDSRSS